MKRRQNTEPGKKAMAIVARNVLSLLEKEVPGADTQRTAASAAKVGKGSMGNLTKPDHNSTIDILAKVADMYGVRVWQLLHPDMPALTANDWEHVETFIQARRKKSP